MVTILRPQANATYADLVATITGASADLNLGITTLLDGATTTATSTSP